MATKFILVSLLLLQVVVTVFSVGNPQPQPQEPQKGKYEKGGPPEGIPKPGSKPQVEFGGAEEDGELKPHAAARGPDPQGRKWCIAKEGLPKSQYKKDYAEICFKPGCEIPNKQNIEFEKRCLLPDCLPTGGEGKCYTEAQWSKASYALNMKYQKTKKDSDCDQGGRAVITNIDPSWGKCVYPA